MSLIRSVIPACFHQCCVLYNTVCGAFCRLCDANNVLFFLFHARIDHPVVPFQAMYVTAQGLSHQLNRSPFRLRNGSFASNLLACSSTCSVGAGSSAPSALGLGRSLDAFFFPGVEGFVALPRTTCSCARSRSACCLDFSIDAARSSRSLLICRFAK